MNSSPDLGIHALTLAYRSGRSTPRAVVTAIHVRIAATRTQNIWIDVLDAVALAPYFARLEATPIADLPLWGIPFAIKDNIDLAGRPTTAACPEFTYIPTESAFVVDQLIAAGAIPLGKTNLDQFATGLVGTRSPYGATANAFDPLYISGGSSAGSAVAVALGQASFALGTDTAGSGRIPAAFNNLVGIKPTRGVISTRGVVPACRSLDCVSVFALDFRDAAAVMRIARAMDDRDPYARPALATTSIGERFVFGVPDELRFDDPTDRVLFDAVVERCKAVGGEARRIPYAAFDLAARLLYDGPWVAERYAGIHDFIQAKPEALHPVTRAILEPAAIRSAVEVFSANATLASLRHTCNRHLRELDCLLLPAAPSHPTQAAVAADPIGQNSLLGTYTNFMNLLDMAAVAVPAGMRANGLPFGVTLCGPAASDDVLAVLGARLHAASGSTRGALGLALADITSNDVQWQARAPTIDLGVCGAHMSGLPLNPQLTALGATFVERTATASRYRLFALPGGPPMRPGLVRQASAGASIEIEVWRLPATALGEFIAAIPAPLGIGKIELADGRSVSGFVCENYVCKQARDITAYGGWRAYLADNAKT